MLPPVVRRFIERHKRVLGSGEGREGGTMYMNGVDGEAPHDERESGKENQRKEESAPCIEQESETESGREEDSVSNHGEQGPASRKENQQGIAPCAPETGTVNGRHKDNVPSHIDRELLVVDDRYNERLQNKIALATLKAKQLNDASKDEFQYDEHLEDGLIRLVLLQPGCNDNPIVCSLFIGSIQLASPFEAVSYVWGSEDNPHRITCNWAVSFLKDGELRFECPHVITNNMTVTENLYRLLLHLRHPTEYRTLWIDRICIDQDECPEKLHEKMSQVRRMSEIYAAAENVIIWLGEEDSETETAFGVMKWMAATAAMTDQEVGCFIDYLNSTDHFSSDELAGDEPSERSRHKEVMEYLKSLLVLAQPAVATPTEDQASSYQTLIILLGVRTFAALLERPWFTRSWTFQEAVSAMSATVMCGSHEVQWDVLYRACQHLQARQIFMEREHSRIRMPFVVDRVLKMGELQREWKRINGMAKGEIIPGHRELLDPDIFYEQRRLKRLLPLLRPTSCKDPRDKVLALLGSSHDDGRWIRFPDYKWPVINLYTCVVSYWVWGIDKMDISFLNHVQASNPERKLPSWVPDWSSPPIATPLTEVADFSASGNTKPEVFMDKIDYFSPLPPFPYFPPLGIEGFMILEVQDVEVDLSNFDRLADMINQFQNPYPTTKLSYLEAYQKTVHPRIPADFRPLEREGETPTFWEFVHNFNSKMSPLIRRPSTSRQSYTAIDLQSQIPSLLSSHTHHHTRSPTPGRAFFITTTGFIGLCPKNTIPGDKVFILLGAATPFVIRVPEDNIVRFVGECFVLGVMHGEALHGRPAQRKRTVVIMR